MRWQIELVFRQCQWVLRLDTTASASPHRVQCGIWARLLAAVVLFLGHAHAGASCWQQHWGQPLARAFLRGGAELARVLRELWHHLLTGARKGRQKSRTNS